AQNSVVATTTANASGFYSAAVPGPLGVGSYSFGVEVIDAYGDISGESSLFSLTIVVVPSVPGAPGLVPAGVGGNQGDNTTDITSPHLSGTTIANATVQLLNSQNNVVGTTIANANGLYSMAVPGPLAVGTYAFGVQVIDQYGDSSGPSSLTS